MEGHKGFIHRNKMIIDLLSPTTSFHDDKATSIDILVNLLHQRHGFFLFSISPHYVNFLVHQNECVSVNLRLQAMFILRNPINTYSGFPISRHLYFHRHEQNERD